MQQQQKDTEKNYTFPQKAWIVGGILALITVILLLLRATFSVLLLILAGTLIAVYFRGLSGLIERKTKWKEGICLTISILGTLILIGLLFWLIGAKVQVQVAELSDKLPTTIENAKQQLNKSSLGQKVVQKISSPKTQQNLQSVAQKFFRSTFGVLGDIYVVLFIGIFFTVAPQKYKKGIVQLVPQGGRPKADDVLNKVGTNLKKWLKGKLFAMLVVAVLTAIGLVIIGVPMWLALAIIAGILNFIPNFGPLIALIPAVLVALMQGPTTAAIVAGLYILVQIAESNFITPMVQQKLISIPPALIIIAQLFIAPLTGGWGLVLATPLMVILIVVVQELYIKKQNAQGGE
ncbi:MAG: AI-2E family transporter [Flavisolibacter sp.]|nr:AI-2E family transporter [Flavisolibacter sp.]